MKRILFLLLILSTSQLIAQSVDVEVFQKTATATTAQVGIRAKTTSGTVDYIGVTFYLMYQSANAAPQSTALNSTIGVDDSKLVTTFNWGTSTRFTNPAQVINPAFDPAPSGGETYDRRYIYGNSDESTPANTQTLTTSWDTLLYITLNTLQSGSPEGGYVYLQGTSDAAGASLTDPAFANIPINVTSGDVPIGQSVLLPVVFTKFDAHCTNSGSVITWATESESNSNYYELERSVDGNNWSSVARIKASGTTSIAHTYQQADAFSGMALYRIKQVDLDGHFTYTSIISSNCEFNDMGVVLYPVPARDLLNVIIQ